MVGLVRLCASEVMVTCLFVLPGCYSIGRVVPSELARSRAMLQMPWSLMVGPQGRQKRVMMLRTPLRILAGSDNPLRLSMLGETCSG